MQPSLSTGLKGEPKGNSLESVHVYSIPDLSIWDVSTFWSLPPTFWMIGLRSGIHGPNMASPPWSHDLLFQRFQLRISIPGAVDGAKKAPDSILIFKNSYELCFFSLLNCNTQIRTPTRGLRKPLLPSKTAYARVTFQEVPTRLPPRKLLQRSLYLTWCDHNSGSEEE